MARCGNSNSFIHISATQQSLHLRPPPLARPAGATLGWRPYGLGEGSIARVEAGECMRSMTEARARELEGRGHQ